MPTFAEIMASNPVESELVFTYEFKDPYLTGGRMALANYYEDIKGRTEDHRVLLYKKANLATSLPKRSVSGRQDLVFSMGNVPLEAWGEIKNIIDGKRATPSETTVTQRLYDKSDMNYVLDYSTYVVFSMEITYSQINIKAGFKDLINTTAFRKKYTYDKYPGIAYA